MANNSKKTVYIIIGVVLFVIAIPVALMLVGLLGGLVYYNTGH